MAVIMRCCNICQNFCYLRATSSLEYSRWRREEDRRKRNRQHTKASRTFGRTQALAHDYGQMEQTGEQLIKVVPCRLLIVRVQVKANWIWHGFSNHSNFFLGAHWVEERLAEEKRIDNTHKQAETFGRTQGLAHDWDKWSRLKNSSSRLCLADF
ncbi:hypothetical protein PoB_004414800 [Plakobranchus ocellatus]|uniref:Uncharacterized protein n=1 Tax=Plakobranchus ocellatus TaxID=259542 RepID=A0AAV4BEN7_9GAST|nr:hypothetical protein PoB_004414800 [Plakobranchus ocellatus]